MSNTPKIHPHTAYALANDPQLLSFASDSPVFEGAPSSATVAYWEGWAFLSFATTVRAYSEDGAIFLADNKDDEWELVSG